MNSLDTLEAARPGRPLLYRWLGVTFETPDPVELDYQRILEILYAEALPGLPGMPAWRARIIYQVWRLHHDLPTHHDAARLCYAIDRYRDQAEVDLQAIHRVDLHTEWRARRWRRLLNLIDHFPADTWLSEAMANDQEYADAVAEAAAARRARGEDAPPEKRTADLRTWSPEVAMLANVYDAINKNTYVLQAVNSEKGKQPQPPEPYARPETALSRSSRRADYNQRKASHQALAKRLVPHRYPDEVEQDG